MQRESMFRLRFHSTAQADMTARTTCFDRGRQTIIGAFRVRSERGFSCPRRSCSRLTVVARITVLQGRYIGLFLFGAQDGSFLFPDCLGDGGAMCALLPSRERRVKVTVCVRGRPMLAGTGAMWLG